MIIFRILRFFIFSEHERISYGHCPACTNARMQYRRFKLGANFLSSLKKLVAMAKAGIDFKQFYFFPFSTNNTLHSSYTTVGVFLVCFSWPTLIKNY